MTETTKLPPMPGHPEPHAYQWTERERRAIERYGSECRRMALDEAARVCEQSDQDGEGPDCWGWHQKDYARAIRALKDKA